MGGLRLLGMGVGLFLGFAGFFGLVGGLGLMGALVLGLMWMLMCFVIL